VAANNELIGGIKGGDRKLVLKSQISPSQLAVGGKLDADQKKVVEEARRNLAAQTKKVDEAVAVIQKKGSSPQEIEAAAKEALVQVRISGLSSFENPFSRRRQPLILYFFPLQ
jgi:hypothetical protein